MVAACSSSVHESRVTERLTKNMALAADRASLLLDHLSSKLRPILDSLLAVGIYYSAKIILKSVYELYTGIKVFVVPRIFTDRDFASTYGKWAVVTGCTAGIGEAFAYELAKKNMNVVLVSRSLEKLERVADKIRTGGKTKVEIVQADFTRGREAFQALETALAGKAVGVLVNNVGVYPKPPMRVAELSEDNIWDNVNVNVATAAMMTRVVLPQMEKRGRGAIIDLSSWVALYPLPLSAIYGASKAYNDYLSQVVECEARGKGITVLTLLPLRVCTYLSTDSVLKPSLTIPSPETYVRSSLAMLGYTTRTHGYWAHALQAWLYGLLPTSLLQSYVLKLTEEIRRNDMKSQ